MARVFVAYMSEEAYSNCEDLSSGGVLDTTSGTIKGTVYETEGVGTLTVSLNEGDFDVNEEEWNTEDTDDEESE